MEITRFPIDLPAFQGSLEQLVVSAQRGEIDLVQIPVSKITADFRRRAMGTTPSDLRDIADFLTLVSRLINLKAQAALPDPNASDVEAEDADGATDDAGQRLAEYRLFKAAAEALLSEAADAGTLSFLGLVSPDVVPVERLRIAPERLAEAFRAVLLRLHDIEPAAIETVTFSVEEMASRLRRRLELEGEIEFEAIFSGVRSRLEAVALFLGLLELLRGGDAIVEQAEVFGPITVTARG